MRLLVVTPFYSPDLGPSAPLMTMLCEDLAKLGHTVTVLTAVPHFPTGNVAPEYRTGKLWEFDVQNSVTVCRVWVPSGNRANLRHRLYTFFVFQMLVTLVGLFKRCDALIVTNPAIETYVPFAILSWLKRRPAIYCVWDLYPDVGVRLGIFRNPGVVSIISALEHFCLRHAAAVHLISHSFVANLAEKGVDTAKLFVVLPWLDTEFLTPQNRRNGFSEEYSLDDKFVVLYAGNLGFSQGLDDLLLAAQQLMDKPNIQIVLVGDGPSRDELVRLAQRLGLNNVAFIPFQPRARLPEVLATADLALVCQKTEIINDSLPSKTFPLLASGRPILAIVDDNSELARLITRYDAGQCVAPGAPAAIAAAIRELSTAPALLQQMGMHGRQCAVRLHSRRQAALQFDMILNRLRLS
jgi:colanic acid biosynthesis glycosyl transferase WcaI